MTETKTTAALHAQLDDFKTRYETLDDVRKVLADAMDEAGDPLAEGYRALGCNGRRPYYNGLSQRWLWLHAPATDASPSRLPLVWWGRLRGFTPLPFMESRWKGYASRRDADDAAARAFLELPEADRRELLKEVYGVASERKDEDAGGG